MSTKLTDSTSPQCWDGQCRQCHAHGCEHHCHYESLLKVATRRVILHLGLTVLPVIITAELVGLRWAAITALLLAWLLYPVVRWLDGDA